MSRARFTPREALTLTSFALALTLFLWANRLEDFGDVPRAGFRGVVEGSVVLPVGNARAGRFDDAVREYTIAGLGDFLFLGSLNAQANRVGDYSHVWSRIEEFWKPPYASHAFGNFEGTVGPVDKKGELTEVVNKYDKNVYSTGVSSGGFNYHHKLATDLGASGVDVMSTANNHMFDRGFTGISETHRQLSKNNIRVTGTTLEDVEDPSSSHAWHAVTEDHGWKIAWVGCTTILCPTCRKSLYATDEAVRKRVLNCHHALGVLKLLKKDVSLDAIIVGAHWGAQFTDKHLEKTEALALQLLEAGATVVFGNHAHVMQDASHYTTTKERRRAYVTYSIGSVTSGLGSSERMWKRRTSAIVYATLIKTSTSSEVSRIRYLPICEISSKLADGSAVRLMELTERTNGVCDQEDAWAEFLLGKEDRARVEDLEGERES